MSTPTRTRNFWGWGYEDQAVGAKERRNLVGMLGMLFDCSELTEVSAPTIDGITLPTSTLILPAALASILDSSPAARAAHTYGKAFRDIVRGLRGEFGVAPDVVAFPRCEQDIVSVLDWATDADLAVVPFGGGSSVVGGVEVRLPHRKKGVVSLDLLHLAGINEVDPVSRTFRAGGGTFGPALSAGLKSHGLALRHFPQSFEFSTLGGWIATRAGGHFATLHTRIDSFVQSVRVVTPTGSVETKKLPSTGAGPDPNGMWIGSEGALGIITSAWIQAQQPPTFKASQTFGFDKLTAALGALRILAQSGLYPSNARVLGKMEALVNAVGDGQNALLLVGFESSDHAVDADMARASDIARGEGGMPVDGTTPSPEAKTAAGTWKNAFIKAPYLRDALVVGGAVIETFETATTWDRIDELITGVRRAATEAATRECGAGSCTVRITHAYPNGAAPYFTVLAPGRLGSRVKQWDAIKLAVNDAIAQFGGTISHHHATGRDHAPHWRAERGEVHHRALAAIKRELDPQGILNPGVLELG